MNEYNRQVEKNMNYLLLENMQRHLAAANHLRKVAVGIIIVTAFVIIALQTWSMKKIEKGISDLNKKFIYLNSTTNDVAENVHDIMEQKVANTSSNTWQPYIIVQ